MWYGFRWESAGGAGGRGEVGVVGSVVSIADGGARDRAGGDKTSVCTTSCGGIFTLTLIF